MSPVLRTRWTPEDRAASVYRELPFTVPPGTAGIRIRLGYDRSAGTIDLGLLDPAGFRGWSGGARTEVVISAMAATPGYLPGRLPPGDWSVLLGLYAVPAGGLDSHIEISFGEVAPPVPPSASRVPRPPRRALPAPVGMRWLAGDFHCHTVHSDGALWPEQLAAHARSTGLDLLAITDHNTVSHHAGLAAAGGRHGVLLLPGQEITTLGGHANAFGNVGWVDFRTDPASWPDRVERAGGIFSPCHPLLGELGYHHPLRRRVRCAEAWHGSWDGTDPAPLEWATAHARVMLGGSDFHRFTDWARLGRPVTWVLCEERPPGPELADAALHAVRDGRVAISSDRDGPLLLASAGQVHAVAAEGLTLTGPGGVARTVTSSRFSAAAVPGLHRLLDDRQKCLALVLVPGGQGVPQDPGDAS